MGLNHSRPAATPAGKAQEERDRRERENRNILLRKGVLIPPSFGTATDLVPPPSSFSASALGVTCSAPHLAVSSHVLGLGPLSNFARGDVISSHLASSSPYRLLSPEHLLSGLFVSASTPSGLANATAGWAADVPAAAGINTEGAAGNGFLSGAILLPSYSPSLLSGFSGSVSTTSSASADLAGHVGGFVSKSFGYDGKGGQLTAYGYFAGSETGVGNDGSGSAVGDASSSSPSQSQLHSSSGSAMGKIGWSYSRRLVLNNKTDSWPGDEYYKNDPFDEKKSMQNERTKLKGSTLLGIGSALTLAPAAGPTSGEGIDVRGASSHISVSSPSSGVEGAVQASLPIDSSHLRDKSSTVASQLDPQAIISSIRSIKPHISGYVSFDLNQVGGSGAVGGYDTYSEDMQKGPPIMVTLYQLKGDRDSEAAATVSQVFTFDRIVTNPLEDRCPKIRNTVSWAVRLKRSVRSMVGYGPDATTVGGPNASATAATSLTAGVAYQVNRGLCYKVNADSRDGVTVGILLKRWAHPRVTFSALLGTGSGDANKIGRVGFKGICLQVESGPLPSTAPTNPPGTVPASHFVNGDWLYGLAGRGNATIGGETPETKAELPDR